MVPLLVPLDCQSVYRINLRMSLVDKPKEKRTMAKHEAYRSEDEALACLNRNRVRVNPVKGHFGKYIIKQVRPVGLKVLGAIDCLVNHHKGYSIQR